MNKKKSLYLLFSVVTVVLIVSLVYIFQISKEKITSQIQTNLENQAIVLVKNLNLEEYEKLISNPNSRDYDENYLRIIYPLQEIHSVLKDKNKFVYTVFAKNKKILFGLDTTIHGDSDKDGVEDHSPLFSEYSEATPELKKIMFSFKKVPYMSKSYSDRWGSFVSYYYPLFNKNNFLGYLGIDMNVDVFTKDIELLKSKLIFLFIILEVFVLFLCIALYRSLKLEEIKNQLEKEVEQKNKEIELNQLSKLAALGEFSSVLTHEINNPLQAIGGFAETILAVADLPLNEKSIGKIKDYSGKILQSSSIIQEIIKSTKNLIRNDLSDDFEIKNFSNILKDTEFLFKDKLAKEGIRYENNVPPSVEMACMPSQIQMVFMNLINNSVFSLKNLPENQKFINIKYSEDSDFHYVSFIDGGAPLSKDIQEKIKNKFFSTKKNGEGSGMGLATIRKIIKKHNGDFYYNNKCSTVCFEFKIPKKTSPFVDKKVA